MRRRSSRSSTEETADIDMTPMLDIVFIMLIFFIVTTSFVKESGIEVNRPSGEETASRVENANIIVGIKPNGEVWIDKHLVDIRSVRANIARLHAENPLGAVIVAADKESKTKVLIQVMDQIRLAGVMNASIATDTD
jgi:biopolymer transport protein ExbD